MTRSPQHPHLRSDSHGTVWLGFPRALSHQHMFLVIRRPLLPHSPLLLLPQLHRGPPLHPPPRPHLLLLLRVQRQLAPRPAVPPLHPPRQQQCPFTRFGRVHMSPCLPLDRLRPHFCLTHVVQWPGRTLGRSHFCTSCTCTLPTLCPGSTSHTPSCLFLRDAHIRSLWWSYSFLLRSGRPRPTQHCRHSTSSRPSHTCRGRSRPTPQTTSCSRSGLRHMWRCSSSAMHWRTRRGCCS